MGAVAAFYEINGPTDNPTVTEISELVFCTADMYAPGNEHPLVRPATGVNRSFVKTLACGFSVAPSISCSDIRIFCDGNIGWTGVTWYVGNQFPDTYRQATGTVGGSGDDMLSVYSGIITSKSNFQQYTESNPLTLPSVKTTGVGIYTKYFCMQVDVSPTAELGALPPEQLTMSWLEV